MPDAHDPAVARAQNEILETLTKQYGQDLRTVYGALTDDAGGGLRTTVRELGQLQVLRDSVQKHFTRGDAWDDDVPGVRPWSKDDPQAANHLDRLTASEPQLRETYVRGLRELAQRPGGPDFARMAATVTAMGNAEDEVAKRNTGVAAEVAARVFAEMPPFTNAPGIARTGGRNVEDSPQIQTVTDNYSRDLPIPGDREYGRDSKFTEMSTEVALHRRANAGSCGPNTSAVAMELNKLLPGTPLTIVQTVVNESSGEAHANLLVGRPGHPEAIRVDAMVPQDQVRRESEMKMPPAHEAVTVHWKATGENLDALGSQHIENRIGKQITEDGQTITLQPVDSTFKNYGIFDKQDTAQRARTPMPDGQVLPFLKRNAGILHPIDIVNIGGLSTMNKAAFRATADLDFTSPPPSPTAAAAASRSVSAGTRSNSDSPGRTPSPPPQPQRSGSRGPVVPTGR